MAARCLHELDVDMGRISNATYEDAEFVTLINQLRAGTDPSSTWQALRNLVEKRNGEKSLWGWKVPGVPIPEVFDLLRNPCLILVHRDMVAMCSRLADSEQQDFLDVYRHFNKLQSELHEIAFSLPYPRLFVSYEKALADPERFSRILARFIGINAGEDDLRRASEAVIPSPAAYVADTRAVAIHGNLDGVFGNRIMGWAARPAVPEAPIRVRITIDGEHVFDIVTRTSRPDVTRHLAYLSGSDLAETSDGHGFEVVIPPELQDGREHEIVVEVVGTEDYRIGDSPQWLWFPKS